MTAAQYRETFDRIAPGREVLYVRDVMAVEGIRTAATAREFMHRRGFPLEIKLAGRCKELRVNKDRYAKWKIEQEG